MAELLHHRTGEEVERVEVPSADRPHQPAGHYGRAMGPARGGPGRSGRGCGHRHGVDAIAAGDEQGAIDVGGASIGIARAESRRRRPLAADAAQRGLVEDIGGGGFADLEHEAVGQQGRGGRTQVGVATVVLVPQRGSEVVEQMHRRAQLEHAVAVVVRIGCAVVGAVAGGHPHVALCVDRRRRPPHPHRSLAVPGGHLEVDRGRTVLRSGDDPSVVGLAVTGVATEPDDHATVGERQRGPVEQEGLIAGYRVDDLVEQLGARVGVEPDQVVLRPARHPDGRHHEELAGRRVDDRGGRDPDCRQDVSAQTGDRGRVEGRAEVDRPQDRPGVGGEGVDGVVFGGGEHPTGEDQRLSVELPVEGGRVPRRCGR